MTKRLRKKYIIYTVSLTVEILVVILCLVSLLFGAASALEWIFILVTTVLEIPASVSSLRKIQEQGEGSGQGEGQGDGSGQGEGQGDGSVVPPGQV